MSALDTVSRATQVSIQHGKDGDSAPPVLVKEPWDRGAKNQPKRDHHKDEDSRCHKHLPTATHLGTSFWLRPLVDFDMPPTRSVPNVDAIPSALSGVPVSLGLTQQETRDRQCRADACDPENQAREPTF